MAPWHLSLAAWNTLSRRRQFGVPAPEVDLRRGWFLLRSALSDRGGQLDIKIVRGLLRGLSALHNTASDGTVRPLARDPRVLIGWPLPLSFGLDGRLLLARRGRVYV